MGNRFSSHSHIVFSSKRNRTLGPKPGSLNLLDDDDQSICDHNDKNCRAPEETSQDEFSSSSPSPFGAQGRIYKKIPQIKSQEKHSPSRKYYFFKNKPAALDHGVVSEGGFSNNNMISTNPLKPLV